jgi:hypothetical protein
MTEVALEKLRLKVLRKLWLFLSGLLNWDEFEAKPLCLALQAGGVPLAALCIPLLPNGLCTSTSQLSVIFRTTVATRVHVSAEKDPSFGDK